jgi:hypothetical protein
VRVDEDGEEEEEEEEEKKMGMRRRVESGRFEGVNVMKELSGGANKQTVDCLDPNYLPTYLLPTTLCLRTTSNSGSSFLLGKKDQTSAQYLPTYLPTYPLNQSRRTGPPPSLTRSLARSLTHSPIHPTGYSFTTATLCRLG